MKNLNDSIRGMLDDSVNDIFAVLQDRLGITSGDISPLLALQLEEKTRSLADVIAASITFQVGSK